VISWFQAFAFTCNLYRYSLRRERTLLITSDQVVVHEGVVREKPESEAEARAFIAGYGVSPAKTAGLALFTTLFC
jgi:septum formation protein